MEPSILQFSDVIDIVWSTPRKDEWPNLQISKDHDLKDLLSETTISNHIALANHGRDLDTRGAHRLAKALTSLASRADIPQLSLWIRCPNRLGSPDSLLVAKIVMDGLRPFTGLKNIAIQFSGSPGGQATEMATATVRSLQQPPKSSLMTPDKSVSLTMLPLEIRYIIIEYVISAGCKREAILRTKDQWTCCKRCMPNALLHYACACPRIAAGDSTTCRCFPDRLALFQVNKMLYADSTYIFFSSNRLVLQYLDETLAFFYKASTEILGAIRILHIKILYDDYASFFNQIPWEFMKIVSIIKDKCNLPRLYLSIDYAGVIVDNFCDKKMPQKVEGMRANIVDGLRPLRGLDRLDIYVNGVKPEVEDQMEKAVMGDDYDAIARGKLHVSNRDSKHVHNEIVLVRGG